MLVYRVNFAALQEGALLENRAIADVLTLEIDAFYFASTIAPERDI